MIKIHIRNADLRVYAGGEANTDLILRGASKKQDVQYFKNLLQLVYADDTN